MSARKGSAKGSRTASARSSRARGVREKKASPRSGPGAKTPGRAGTARSARASTVRKVAPGRETTPAEGTAAPSLAMLTRGAAQPKKARATRSDRKSGTVRPKKGQERKDAVQSKAEMDPAGAARADGAGPAEPDLTDVPEPDLTSPTAANPAGAAEGDLARPALTLVPVEVDVSASGDAPAPAPPAASSDGGDMLPLPDAPFHPLLEELGRDELSVLLYVSLLPKETAQLVKALRLSQPGFRREGLGPFQRCDLLADELSVSPACLEAVLGAMRKAWERPVLSGWPLAPAAAADLLDACSGDGALPLALWRVLCDPERDVRSEAKPFLKLLFDELYGPAPASEGGSAPSSPHGEEVIANERRAEDAEGGPASAEDEEEDEELLDARRQVKAVSFQLEEARRKLEYADKRAESTRVKAEEAREKLQSWLKDARAREAKAVEESARARDAADAARADLERLRAELSALRKEDAAQEAQRLRGEVRELEARAGALEARLERARDRERELESEVARARSAAPAGSPSAAGPSAQPPEEPEDAATWLMPVYTREFYSSLEGWDRRIQRAAFKQAGLLALDHRHPSLRALALEGLPGYFRVRVATDVRLLYRRTDRQNTIEILSLIDREDLDRYIKQAKTR